jgi:glycosyltransferase involved in cell wall biosynthesis
MKKVLVIAYYFPPMGLSGVQRTLKFVKYLPQFGWQPTVLTVSPGGYYAKDYSLLDEISSLDVKIIRTGSIDPTRFFRKSDVVRMPREIVRKFLNKASQVILIPDNKIGWRRKAISKIENVLKTEKFDAVFATAPPYTDFLIGDYLKEKYQIPLMLDYRDSWLDNPYNFYLTPLHRLRHFLLEKGVVSRCDKIIAINRRVKELLLVRYPFLRYNDVSLISQGFDPADFETARDTRLPATDKMRITYSGTFFGRRTPKYLLKALRKVLWENPKLQGRIEACFVGYFRNENLKYVKKLYLQNAVKIVGYVDHIESIKYLLTSHVLWMTIGRGKGDDMMSTGKLYEYIGARKPILGCVPDGVAKATILESDAGVVVEPDDVNAIADAILHFYHLYQRKELRGPSDAFVEKYNRVHLTAELARELELLVDYTAALKQKTIAGDHSA